MSPGIALFGSEGRMGAEVLREAGDAVVARYDSAPGALDPETPLPDAVDVVMDFSAPAAWADLDRLLEGAAPGVSLVSGTTGIGDDGRRTLERWAEGRAVLWSPNMSLGILVLGRLVDSACRMLGEGFDVEIVELHHRGKVDSPSGTALSLAGMTGAAEVVFGRRGAAGPRPAGQLGVHAVRGGDVPGEHQVHLLGEGERLTLTHAATSRRVFAIGALRAAAFLSGKSPGLYGMGDLIGGTR